MRDEEWTELQAQRMARHVTMYHRNGRLYAVQSLRMRRGDWRRRLALTALAAFAAGAGVMWLLGGGR